jgi:hypothetical protein
MVSHVWCGVVWYGVVWCGVVRHGVACVVWCGVVWCGVVCLLFRAATHSLMALLASPDPRRRCAPVPAVTADGAGRACGQHARSRGRAGRLRAPVADQDGQGVLGTPILTLQSSFFVWLLRRIDEHVHRRTLQTLTVRKVIGAFESHKDSVEMISFSSGPGYACVCVWGGGGAGGSVCAYCVCVCVCVCVCMCVCVCVCVCLCVCVCSDFSHDLPLW